jgi:hypothetical protein
VFWGGGGKSASRVEGLEWDKLQGVVEVWQQLPGGCEGVVVTGYLSRLAQICVACRAAQYVALGLLSACNRAAQCTTAFPSCIAAFCADFFMGGVCVAGSSRALSPCLQL